MEAAASWGRRSKGGKKSCELEAAGGHKEGTTTTTRHGNMWEKRRQCLLVKDFGDIQASARQHEKGAELEQLSGLLPWEVWGGGTSEALSQVHTAASVTKTRF